MIERELVINNKFSISPELVGLFKGNWNNLVRTRHTPNFALPFFHLKNEPSKVWSLKTIVGFENALTSSNSVKSLSALSEYVEYGELTNEFYLFLLDKVNRAFVRAEIVKRYFPEVGLPDNSSYDYLETINSQILNDPPKKYKKRIQKLLGQSKEEIEVEGFIREGAFKKQIPILYNNTCAITGLRVETTFNASMIDACHIVPWAESHNDTISNGISLCPNLHRAFDRGLVAVDNDYKTMISGQFEESDSPFNLSQFGHQSLILPYDKKYWPSRENLEWHRKRWGFS